VRLAAASAALRNGSPLNTGLPKYTVMQPSQVGEPFHRPGWVFEEKYDGWRIVSYKDGGRVRLLSRNDVDHARKFRELAAAIAALPQQTLVLDGEVAIFDQAMHSRFDLLRQSDPGASSRRRPSTSRSPCSIGTALTSVSYHCKNVAFISRTR
jgi:ATP-dependent DNA ligase